MEIQKFLAPQSLTNIINSNGSGYGVTLPSTLIVELIYATGIVGCVLIAYFIGRAFYRLENLLSLNQNNIIIVSLYFYLYCYMFDFIRNGSAFLVSLFVPLSILVIMVKRPNKS